MCIKTRESHSNMWFEQTWSDFLYLRLAGYMPAFTGISIGINFGLRNSLNFSAVAIYWACPQVSTEKKEATSWNYCGWFAWLRLEWFFGDLFAMIASWSFDFFNSRPSIQLMHVSITHFIHWSDHLFVSLFLSLVYCTESQRKVSPKHIINSNSSKAETSTRFGDHGADYPRSQFRPAFLK